MKVQRNKSVDEEVRYWRPKDEPAVEVLEVVGTRRHFTQFHERYCVCVLNGKDFGTARYRRGSYEQHVDGLFLLEPGESHATVRSSGPLSFSVIYLDPSLVASVAETIGMRGGVHWRATMTPNCEESELTRRLISVMREENEDATKEALSILLSRTIERYAEPERSQPRVNQRLVQRARDVLHDHVETGISLDEVGKLVGATSFALIREFRLEHGIPPHQYLQRLRVERARKLLASGKSGTETAHAIGFSDQSHFHRTFVKVMGVTPGAYARGAR